VNGFSAEWLDLREPADHRGRNRYVLAALRAHFAERETVTVVDLGCGTGSNLRAAAPHLPRQQQWLLVDHDPALLALARDRLTAWADAAERQGESLRMSRQGRELVVAFRQADLAADLERVLEAPADLVTAAALFDLVSDAWIERFVRAVARQSAVAYTPLNYDGVEIWSPTHPADADILAAFNTHQTSDKGFGPSLGPAATEALTRAFRARGYEVKTGDSPTPFDGDRDAGVIRDIVACVVQAARDSGRVAETDIAGWQAARASGASCTIGHIDLLALPGR
jgi:SAM-dependent methyltransferase